MEHNLYYQIILILPYSFLTICAPTFIEFVVHDWIRCTSLTTILLLQYTCSWIQYDEGRRPLSVAAGRTPQTTFAAEEGYNAGDVRMPRYGAFGVPGSMSASSVALKSSPPPRKCTLLVVFASILIYQKEGATETGIQKAESAGSRAFEHVVFPEQNQQQQQQQQQHQQQQQQATLDDVPHGDHGPGGAENSWHVE